MIDEIKMGGDVGRHGVREGQKEDTQYEGGERSQD